MNKYYNELLNYLENEDKENAVSYSLGLLDKNEIDITTLYEEVLAPSLNNMVCKDEDEDLFIWKEHVRTSIVRTIIECCYPYIVKVVKDKHYGESKKKVIVVALQKSTMKLVQKWFQTFLHYWVTMQLLLEAIRQRKLFYLL